MPVYLAKRKILKYVSGTSVNYALYLPKVGPFSSLALTPVSGLTSETISGSASLNTTLASPLQRGTYTINSTASVGYSGSGQAKQFVWVNHLVFGGANARIRVVGTAGTGGSADPLGSTGGNGGGGSGGGGGGIAWDENGPDLEPGSGGNGGSKAAGQSGESGAFSTGGSGGSGWSSDYASGYTFGNGADGGVGASSPFTNYGAGANGAGGGGAGGGYIYDVGKGGAAGGGGGGGGGLCCWIGNWLECSATSTIDCSGGAGGLGDALETNIAFNGGVGGKGVIYWAFVKKTGTTPTTTAATGSTRIFEISRNWTTLTERLWSDTWNNLD